MIEKPSRSMKIARNIAPSERGLDGGVVAAEVIGWGRTHANGDAAGCNRSLSAPSGSRRRWFWRARAGTGPWSDRTRQMAMYAALTLNSPAKGKGDAGAFSRVH